MTPPRCLAPLAFILTVSVLSSCDSPTRTLHPLIAIGVDSATWDVIDPMMERGELPNFRSLVERGARCDLVTLPPLTSPVAWTTYATGTFPRQHNILDFTYPYVEGERHPVESTLRKEPAIWNVASEYGRTVGSVGYYVTHPAEIVNGFVVSDALLQWNAGTTYPEELAKELDRVDTNPEVRATYRRFIPWDYDPGAADRPSDPYHELTVKIHGRVDKAAILAENVRRASEQLLPRNVDLFLTYFRIVDYASHTAWLDYDDSDFETAPDPTEKAMLEDLIPESYRFVDDFLGTVIREKGESVNILIVSDHGAGSATGPYAIESEELANKLTGNHRFDGVLLAAGPDIQPGVYEGVTMMDVTPLMLALLGIPISEELPGRVPDSMLDADFLRAHPAGTVPSYRKTWRFVESHPMDSGKDREALEDLQALGYVGAQARAGRGSAEPEMDFWNIAPDLRSAALQGELLYHLMRDEPDQAEALLVQLRERDPTLARTMPEILAHTSKLMEASFDFRVFPENAIERFSNAARSEMPPSD